MSKDTTTTKYEGHTAGPWQPRPGFPADDEDIFAPSGSGRGIIAAVRQSGNMSREEMIANRNLCIAAPDLLAERDALRAQVAQLRDALGDGIKTCKTAECGTHGPAYETWRDKRLAMEKALAADPAPAPSAREAALVDIIAGLISNPSGRKYEPEADGHYRLLRITDDEYKRTQDALAAYGQAVTK